MKAIVRQADRVAIWHDPAPARTFYTLAEVDEERRNARELGHGGRTPRLAGQVIPFPKHHNTEVPFEEAPEHDWTQHGLGDPEHWEEENHFRQFDAALDAQGNHQFPGMDQIQPTGENMGSTHAGTERHVHPGTGENWLVKQAPQSAPFLAHGDVAASAIQQYSGLKTPPTFLTEHHGTPASAQLMFPGAKDAFPGKNFDPEKLSGPDLMTIQKHHALDWLLGNHDAHGGQFIRDQDGDLVGIDKGQAFKHYNQDRLHWNYHPNSSYGEQEPVYNTLYRNYAQGGKPIFDPREGELGQFIQHLQDIPDNELMDTLTPYANEAADRGSLGKVFGGYSGHAPGQRFKPNADVKGFLEHAVQRKNNLMADFGDLYDRATAHRMTGTKIARRRLAAPPQHDQMTPEHDPDLDLGSHGAQLYSDPQGQWIVKKPPRGMEFTVPLDLATAQLQKRVGLTTPETHAVPMDGDLALVSKRLPGARQAFGGPDGRQPIHHKQLAPGDLETLQKHQAFDWLIGNHDAHVGNFLRTPDGALVGIDKGQAGKYYGRDRLDPRFHPNKAAREPVYNRLWRQHIRGQHEMADPRTGPLGEFVNRLQSIPDHELRSMFAPYAHAAAAAGRLASGKAHPGGNLSEPSFAPNDPDAFLDAMVARKNNLHADLGGLYDKANKARSRTLRSQPQPITPGLDPDQFQVHEAAGLGDVLNQGLSTVQQVLTPKTPGTTPPPKPSSAPAAPAPPTPPSTPGAPPTPSGQTNMPATKGYDPSKQTGWAALGIPTGIPSTYKGPYHPGQQGQYSEYGGVTTTFGPGSAGYGTSPQGGGAGGGAAGGAAAGGAAGGTGGAGAPVNYNPSSGVEQWRPHVEEGLRRNGLPTTPDYVNKVLHQMQTESSGNPKAINNTDINAINGTPSKGLLQTIDPTFRSHHLPGDADDPYDPQANIDAAIGYAKERYGPTLMDSSGNGMGSGHGY